MASGREAPARPQASCQQQGQAHLAEAHAAVNQVSGGGGGGGGGSCCAPAWSSSQVYVGGNLVTFNGHTWRAKWWTQSETPGHADVWADQGSC